MRNHLTLFFAIFASLFVENLLVLAVNSPQMTFYTPPSHETMVHLESKYAYSATLKLTRPKPFLAPPRFSIMNVTDSKSGSGPEEDLKDERRVREFVVLGPDYPFHGVTAVIQEMNLRASSDKNGCRDFVQFADVDSKLTKSQKICGHISKDDWSNQPSDSRLQRTYFNPSGGIHLYFYSDPENDPGNFNIDEDIGIEIVFTSYTVCPNPANDWKKLHACSKTEEMSCIYSSLFCDSKIDCGFPGEFGVDEQGCYLPYIYMAASIVGGILLTATLIYLFLRWVTRVPKEYQRSNSL